MSDQPDKLDPMTAHEKIMELVAEFSATDPDVASVEHMMAELQQVAEAAGVEVPGMAAHSAAINEGMRQTELFGQNFDAAMWVGDLKRANELAEAGVQMDHAAVMGMSDEEYAAMQDQADLDDEAEEPEELTAEDIAAFMAEMGIEDDPAAFETPADQYGDIANGVPGAIEAFIATGGDPNVPTGEAMHTALLAALDAPARRAAQIETLIAAGADARVVHAYGDNALSWAMGYHHPETVTRESEAELVACLMAHGADPEHVTPSGSWNVLHRAIIQGGLPQVAALLQAGVRMDVNLFEDFEPEKLAGLTPLMLAAPKPDVLALLLDHGADPFQVDEHGRAPLGFIADEAKAARARAQTDDPWTLEHAEALEKSLRILQARLS